MMLPELGSELAPCRGAVRGRSKSQRDTDAARIRPSHEKAGGINIRTFLPLPPSNSQLVPPTDQLEVRAQEDLGDKHGS